jgi:uncharacterized protein (TIRG00374 family)
MKYVKVLISALLIAVILVNVDLREVRRQLANLQTYWLAVTFAIMLVQFPNSTWKWSIALEVHQLRYTFSYLLKVLLIGFFFNSFLPTSIGGDGYRAIKTMPAQGFKSRAVSAVLLERLAGLAALLFIALLGSAVLWKEHYHIVTYFVATCVSGMLFVMALTASHKLGLFDRLYRSLETIRTIEIITHNYDLIASNRSRLLYLAVVSVLYQAVAICIVYSAFKSVNVDASYAQCALISAVSGVISILPISVNGIGVMEGSIVVAATQLGLNPEPSVVVAFLLRVLVVPFSLLCGILYAFESGAQRLAHREVE